MKNFIVTVTFLLGLLPTLVQAEWNPDWSYHQKINLDMTGVTQAAADVPVLVRLHSGNFDFLSANIDGGDLRFVAADDVTELPYFIEKFDAINELAIIWVKLPSIDPVTKDAHFNIYAGNEAAATTSSAKAVFGEASIADFEFDAKTLLSDSGQGVAMTGDLVAQPAGLIGGAATFSGSPVTLSLPESSVSSATGFTWSAWVKPAAIPQTASLLKVGETINVAVQDAQLALTVSDKEVAGGELKPQAWQHVALTIAGETANVYLDGVAVATTDITALELPLEAVIAEGFTGEMDALHFDKVARDANWLSMVNKSQGMNAGLVQVQAAEAAEEEEGGEHSGYMGILIDSLTIDAKIVIGILAVMLAISIWVMWAKFALVSKTDKGNKEFLEVFQDASPNELLQLENKGEFANSNLFMLYLAGLREIKKRVSEGGKLSLSGSSMDAIKAGIDAELVRETQRQNAGIVLLTIAISGGPFLGLLGTVVGVMITFAAIAAAGDVNVNAIAPGIAAALLATVAGLAVAIPALFGYNYLASRIKEITIAMQIFVDEFITRVAELYGKK